MRRMLLAVGVSAFAGIGVAGCADGPGPMDPAGDRPSFMLMDPVEVYLTGPTLIEEPDLYTWTAHPSGGTGSYTYDWEIYYEWYGAWAPLGGTQSTRSFSVDETDGSFSIRVTVSSGGDDDSDTLYVLNMIGSCGEQFCE